MGSTSNDFGKTPETGELTSSAGASGVLRNPIAFLLVPQFTVLSLASAIEPLRIANRYLPRPYEWRLYSPDGESVADDNGIQIAVHGAAVQASAPGTLLICADQQPEKHVTPALAAWLRRISHLGTRIVSIDAAAFVLAKADLLVGHPVTMHWEVTSAFAERYPHIEVVNTLFEIGNGPISCAGGTAVLDLMLNLIEADHGELIAQKVAEHCIREKLRRGGDSQRLRPPHERLAIAMQAGDSAADGRVEVAEIARMVGVSERQLLRLYRRYLGQSPSRFHLAQRLDRARALLRSTAMTVTDVGASCGFASPAHFARAFRKAYGHAPSKEREVRSLGLMADRQSEQSSEPASTSTEQPAAALAHQTSRRRYT